MGKWLLIGLATWGVATASTGCAQLSLVRLTHFTSPAFGGSGTVGVSKDSVTGMISALDFDQLASIHVFTAGGQHQFAWSSNYCNPSLPSPNGVTIDRSTGHAWIVDNHNGKLVAEMTPTGNCLGAWPMTSGSNPMSIAHHGLSGHLFVGSYAAISRWTKGGLQVGPQIPVFFPNMGSWIVSGLAWVAPTDRLIVAQNGGSDLYEVDITGSPLSITSLLPWGITNIQGLDYDPATGHLLVVDNANARIHVFDYLPPTTPMSLSVTTAANGAATLIMQNLPATTGEGWTFISTNLTAPAGTGTVFGLHPDPITAFLASSFLTPQVGHPFHWSVSTLPVWPSTPFSFPPGTFTSLAGQTLDIVTLALDGQGVGIQASNVARVTF